MTENSALIPLPVGRSQESFLRRVFRHAQENGLLTDEQIAQLSDRLAAFAETVADRDSTFMSPSDEEISGAQIRAADILSFGLQRLGGNSLSGAAQCLATTPFRTIIKTGEEEYATLQTRLAAIVKRIERKSLRLSLDKATNVSMIFDAWADATLKDLAHAKKWDFQSSQLATMIWDLHHQYQIGLALERKYRSYFFDNPQVTYAQCVGNLTARHALGDTKITPVISFQRIMAFCQRCCRNGQLKPEVKGELADWLPSLFKSLPDATADWLQNVWWPELAGRIGKFSEEKRTIGDCLASDTFYPVDRPSDAPGADLLAPDKSDLALLIQHFLLKTEKERIGMLKTLNGGTIAMLLDHVMGATEDAEQAERLLQSLPTWLIARVFYTLGFNEDDFVGFEPIDFPEWLYLYCRNLNKPQCAALRRAFRQIDPEDPDHTLAAFEKPRKKTKRKQRSS